MGGGLERRSWEKGTFFLFRCLLFKVSYNFFDIGRLMFFNLFVEGEVEI